MFILNFSMLTAYRGNFVNYLISGSIWGVFSILSMVLITANVTEVLGWKRHEILVLTGVSQIVMGIQHMFFSSNFERFPLYIQQGKLDSYLLKPVDAQVLVSVWLIRIISFSRLIIAGAFLGYLIIAYKLPVTIWTILGFIPLIICSVIILYSIWLMVTTLTIWFTRLSNIPEVLYSISAVMRFPPEVYREVTFFLFFFLFPLLLIGATPAKQLLGQLTATSLGITLLFAVVLLVVSRKFWLFALRSYTSASS